MSIELEKEGLRRLALVAVVVVNYALAVIFLWMPKDPTGSFLLGIVATAVLGMGTFGLALVITWVLKGFNIRTRLSSWFE